MFRRSSTLVVCREVALSGYPAGWLSLCELNARCATSPHEKPARARVEPLEGRASVQRRVSMAVKGNAPLELLPSELFYRLLGFLELIDYVHLKKCSSTLHKRTFPVFKTTTGAVHIHIHDDFRDRIHVHLELRFGYKRKYGWRWINEDETDEAHRLLGLALIAPLVVPVIEHHSRLEIENVELTPEYVYKLHKTFEKVQPMSILILNWVIMYNSFTLVRLVKLFRPRYIRIHSISTDQCQMLRRVRKIYKRDFAQIRVVIT